MTQQEEINYAIKEAIQVMEHYDTGEDFGLITSLRRMRELEQKLNLSGIGSKRPQFTLEEITEAIKTQWVKDFGKLMDDDTERDGYFICGFVHEALKAACASGWEANRSRLSVGNRKIKAPSACGYCGGGYGS